MWPILKRPGFRSSIPGIERAGSRPDADGYAVMSAPIFSAASSSASSATCACLEGSCRFRGDPHGRQVVRLVDEHGRIIRWDPRLGRASQINVFQRDERDLARGDRIQWRLAKNPQERAVGDISSLSNMAPNVSLDAGTHFFRIDGGSFRLHSWHRPNPSTRMSDPEINPALSERTKSTALAMSAGVPQRPTGEFSTRLWTCGWADSARSIGV